MLERLKRIGEDERYIKLIAELESQVKEIEDKINDFSFGDEIKNYYDRKELYSDEDIVKYGKVIWLEMKKKFVDDQVEGLCKLEGYDLIVKGIKENIEKNNNNIYNSHFTKNPRASVEDMDKIKRKIMIEVIQILPALIYEYRPVEDMKKLDPYQYDKE